MFFTRTNAKEIVSYLSAWIRGIKVTGKTHFLMINKLSKSRIWTSPSSRNYLVIIFILALWLVHFRLLQIMKHVIHIHVDHYEINIRSYIR